MLTGNIALFFVRVMVKMALPSCHPLYTRCRG